MRKIGWLIIPVAFLGLLAFVILANRPAANSTAFTLQPHQCFDIPGETQIGDVATVSCGRQHDAEVLAIGRLTLDSAAPGATVGPQPYPGTTAIGEWVGANCGPGAIAGYTGKTDNSALAVGYFFPSEDAWSRGERQITCYLHSRDGSPLTQSLLDHSLSPTDGDVPS